MATEPVSPQGSDAPTLRPDGGQSGGVAPGGETVDLSGSSAAGTPTILPDSATGPTLPPGTSSQATPAMGRRFGDYELSREGTAAIRVSGAELMGRYQLTISKRGHSVLVSYRKSGP